MEKVIPELRCWSLADRQSYEKYRQWCERQSLPIAPPDKWMDATSDIYSGVNN